MADVKCGICGAGGSIDDFDNLYCGTCKATGTRGIDGADYWEPDETWTDDGMEGEHKRAKHRGGEAEDHPDEELEDEGDGDDENEDDGDENEGQGEGSEDDFDIVFEARDYQHDSDNQDAFADPISIVVDGVGKLLPAVRWLRDLTSLRDGKPIGLEEAKAAMVAVAKEDKRIEVKDVPAEASNLVLSAATFANVLAREHTPKEEGADEEAKDDE
jgi:hypothetical protein